MSTAAPPPSLPALPAAPPGEGLAAEMLARLFEHARPLVDALFAQVTDGVTLQAQDFSLCFANPAAARILGATSPEELLRKGSPVVFEHYEVFDAAGHPL
ncbi:MAG TPA: hypothetical protein VEZ71_18940, partial [Archangium sp.]|nr:hypothetical protein [Archangium sp.]